MTLKGGRGALALAAGLVAAAPGAALAGEPWRGSTTQQYRVIVTPGAGGHVRQVAMGWRATCRRGGWVNDSTVFRRPRSSARHFSDAGAYRTRYKGGYRARIRVDVRATRFGDAWRGRLRLRMTVTRAGRIVDRCRVTTRFSATAPRKSAPQPLPAPAPTPAPAPMPPPAHPGYSDTSPEAATWTLQVTADPLHEFGANESFSEQNGSSVSAYAVPAELDFHIRRVADGRTVTWRVRIRAPDGQQLKPGRYDASDTATQTRGPQMELERNGVFCHDSERRQEFTIEGIGFRPSGTLDFARFSFDQQCGAPGHVQDELRGKLAFATVSGS